MVRGAWMLGIVVTVGLVWKAGTAEDATDAQNHPGYVSGGAAEPYAASRTIAAPTAASRPAATGTAPSRTPGIQNYYRELFGNKPRTATTSADQTPSATGRAVSQSAPRPHAAAPTIESFVPPESGVIQQTGLEAPAPLERPRSAPVSVPGALPAETAAGGTVRADYVAPAPPMPSDVRPMRGFDIEPRRRPMAETAPEPRAFVPPSIDELPAPAEPEEALPMDFEPVRRRQDLEPALDDAGFGASESAAPFRRFTRTAQAEDSFDASSHAPAAEGMEETSAEPDPFGASAGTAAGAIPAAAEGPQTPSVTLRWEKRSDVLVGRECACALIVTNSGKVPAADVIVEAFFPESVRLTDAEPRPADSVGRLAWRFGTLEPGAEQAIQIKMIPSRRGDIATTAHVRFTGTAGAAFTVEEPMLKVAVQGPKQVMLGDPASQIVLVSNPGTGAATNVVLEAHVPAG
ncbi:MAG: hypothetical protein KY476_26470, partial [Planctomycetes bacterium]|nr:hypothetical protein [Planctomycetota bacterium]